MKHPGFRVCSIGFVFAVLELFAIQPASADALTYNGLFYASPDTVRISYTGLPNNLNRNVSSGGLKFTNTTPNPDVTFIAWCLDIFDNVTSQNYTLETATSFIPWPHVPLTPGKALALERLASNNPVTDRVTSSAFQLAVWEIMDENLLPYSLSNGSFQASNNSVAGTIALANTWLSNLGTATPTMTLGIWSANNRGSSQDLAVFTRVPEPGTLAMMLAGIGLVGFVRRRRNKNTL